MRKTVGLSHSEASKGIPIGNLTSQIFANIYLNEFDRYVRQNLKPQAYMRYGDDFVIFCNSKEQVDKFRQQATAYLLKRLSLPINPKNDIVVKSSHGLRFLGHFITKDMATVDKHTTASALPKISMSNIASYKSLYFDKTTIKRLDWILLENIDISNK